MTIKITGRKIEVTEGLKSYIEKKLAKLERYFSESATANVTISVQKDRHIIEVTIFQDSMIFRAEVSNDDMYAAVDKVEDVLDASLPGADDETQKHSLIVIRKTGKTSDGFPRRYAQIVKKPL